MRRTTAVASSAKAPAPTAMASGTVPIDDEVRPWARAGAAVRSVRLAAPQSANPNRLRKPSGRMRHPEEITRQNPADPQGTTTPDNAGVPNLDPPCRRLGGEPESGNHTGVGIHAKESLSMCIAGKSIPLGIDRGPNSERMVNARAG